MKLLDKFCARQVMRKRIAGSRDRLYRIALSWCGDEMAADDLVQETLIYGLQRVHQLRKPECLNAWLYSILNNCWKQYLRRQRHDIDIDEETVIAEEEPEKMNSGLEVVFKVRKAILNLPVDQRQIITLVDLEGFSYAEVANILDIPIGTVMSRLNRSRKSLQRNLTRFHFQPSEEFQRLRSVK